MHGVDLTQPCSKFADALTEIFEVISLEELVRASECVVQFLIEEKKINEASTDLLSGFSYYRFYYIRKKGGEDSAVFFVQTYLQAFENIMEMKRLKI